MKSISNRWSVAAGVAIVGACLASQASAGCGLSDTAPQPMRRAPAMNGFQRVALLQVADFNAARLWGDEPVIVGLWKIQFLSKGNPGIPDRTVLDDGFVTWHADGTELMNSGRPPFSGSFCMGVWKQIGRSTFKLNHYALSWDTDNGTTFIGPTNIRETVTVSADRNHYYGTVTLTQYQTDGVTPAGPSINAVVKATRIEP
jgi:hypothetical protein